MDDVIVIGGSFAGISAALAIARARRVVRVVDSGLPRNRFSPAAHNVFGLDGVPPGEALARARGQLMAYPTVIWENARVSVARTEGDAFALELAGGGQRQARRLVLAYGVADQLPAIDGLAECWGRSVLHCPYCHGYEVAGRHWGALVDPAFLTHIVPLYRDWTEQLTIFTNGRTPDAEARAVLARFGVAAVTARVLSLSHDAGQIRTVETEAGGVAVEALFAPSLVRGAADLADQLGCVFEQAMLGRFVQVDSKAMTSVPGVYAAGDMAGPMHSISLALGAGSAAGAFAHQSLVFPAISAAP